MSVVDTIIKDSIILTLMDEKDPEEFKDISLEALNDLFDIPNKPFLKNIIFRIAFLYEDIYPVIDDKHLIQLIKDLKYLSSSKIEELLILLKFYPNLKDINKETNGFDIYNFLKDTTKFSHFFNLLKAQNITFNSDNFSYACNTDHIELVKYICENGNIKEYQNGFQTAVENNSVDIVEYLISLNLIQEIDIHYDDDYIFRYSCYCGDFEMVKQLWLFSLRYEKNFLDSSDDEFFIDACKSGNIELIDYLYNIIKEYKGIYLDDIDTDEFPLITKKWIINK